MQEQFKKENSFNNTKPIWREIVNWFNKRFSKEENVVSADVAYCRATYGMNTNVENLIKLHQHQINRIINDKTAYKSDGNTFIDYRCVYSFPKDVAPYIDRILSVFIEKGYTIMNLSEKIDELKDDNVYLISWYKKSL